MAIAGSLLLAAVGCGDDETAAGPSPPPATSPSESAGETATPPEPTPRAPLDWQSTGRSVDDRVIVGERWTAVASGSEVRFESASDDTADVTLSAVGGAEVDAVLLAGDTAVVSYAYGGEVTTGLGYRVDLTTGERVEIVTPQPANGGDWALGDDSLYYPALGEDERACLATLAVSDGNGEDGWCPPGRVGIAELDANADGVAAMLFDYDSDISCRTLTLLDRAGEPQPVEGPRECVGWDVAATATGVVFSEVPQPRRQERAVFHAVVDGTVRRLGRGTTGSLTSCGGDAFFVRDPSAITDPARLMRWDGSALSVAYESDSRGEAFLGTPECADAILTVSSFGTDGDEQVSARVS